ncbi:MAG: hypothetical protein NC324_10470 [Bacteroides sp.]|nr:hypothetical protein [Bacteroides sp.]
MISIGLMDKMFLLPFKIHTVDFVVNELILSDQKIAIQQCIDQKLISVRKFTANEITAIVSELSGIGGNLSLTDCSACYYAREESLILVTGDKQLRNYANKCKVEVHGILFLFEQMVKHKIIDCRLAVEKLKKLKEINPRLPHADMDRLIASFLYNP